MKAACFSAAVMDYFPQQGQFLPGGNALNQAMAFKYLGWQSAFLGALGDDPAGDAIEKRFAAQGIDTLHLRRLKGSTASNKIVNDEAGERHSVPGSWQGGVYSDFRLSEKDWDYLQTFDIWSTHANGNDFAETLARKSSNTLLAVDFMHFDTYALLEMGLHTLDLAYFGGTQRQVDDLIRISRNTKTVLVLTLGAQGSIAIEKGKTYVQAALPLERVVDTTGCGDAFQAGFTAKYFRTKDISQALQAGAELGRLAACRHGGAAWALS